ncbi:MAG: DUF4398 domain-containing protein [Deltaproteobacteria bacterium]|nr:DUF4398 domain-containing protein [Deltaproteobacteria bacterium]
MRKISKIKVTMLAMIIVAMAFAAGCASTPLRTETSTSGIRAAEEAGAANVPKASLHLMLAKEELELARGLSAKGENDKASSMLLRAESDAELSLALAHSDTEKLEARAAVERVRQLRRDNP